MSDPHQITVRVQALNGTWETLGVDRYNGVVPESLSCSANRWGPDTCAFSLRRDAVVLGTDISTWTPCEIEAAGVVVWDGRIRATPTSESDGPVISVQGQGWQYHLDDDLYDRTYVHTRLSDFQDTRTASALVPLTDWPAGGQISNDGTIVMGWAADQTVPAGAFLGVTYDMGPGQTAKRVVIAVDAINPASTLLLYVRGHDNLSDTAAFTSGGLYNDAVVLTGAGGVTSGTYPGTFTTGRRYVTIIHAHSAGAPAAAAIDRLIRIKSVQVFADTSYESGNASILKLDQIAKDALDEATLLLSADRSEIKAGTFPIPEFAVTDSTPRQAIETANAYENYETKMLIGRRLAVRPRASSPIYEIGAWSGAEFQDASAGSGDNIVNRVIVRGTGPDGAAVRVDRRSSDIGLTTLADRRLFLHTRTISANAAITASGGQRIADLQLTANATAPFAGSFTAVPGGVRRTDNGSEPHPAWLLRDTGQLVRCTDRVDPDTGNWGRAGEIDTVTFTADTLSSEIAINENRAGLDALLARYQVVVGQRQT